MIIDVEEREAYSSSMSNLACLKALHDIGIDVSNKTFMVYPNSYPLQEDFVLSCLSFFEKVTFYEDKNDFVEEQPETPLELVEQLFNCDIVYSIKDSLFCSVSRDHLKAFIRDLETETVFGELEGFYTFRDTIYISLWGFVYPHEIVLPVLALKEQIKTYKEEQSIGYINKDFGYTA